MPRAISFFPRGNGIAPEGKRAILGRPRCIIRKLPGDDKLKILAFSANAFEEDRKKSLEAGLDGHITKPLKIEELLAALKRFSV